MTLTLNGQSPGRPGQTKLPLASARDVVKAFGPETALDGVSLDIHAGEAVGLLGPNGAGKSTLIGLLTGLRRVDSGTVELFGKNPLNPSARLALGVTPQATAVPQTLKVREAVELVAAHFPDPVPTAELLQQFGLEEMAGKQCGGLSGGQQRRLLVAIALVGRPSLVILDEPTTGLDVEAREVLWEQLRRYRRDGGTLLITSHYLAEIEALADRVVVIDQGKIVADGTLDDIRGHISVRRVSLRSSTGLDIFAALPHVVDASRTGGVTQLVSRNADGLVRQIVRDDIDFSRWGEEPMAEITVDTAGRERSRVLRRRGAVILALFAVLWAAVGASGLAAGTAGTVRIAAVVPSAAIVLLAFRSGSTEMPERQRYQPHGWYRHVGIVNLAQAAAIAVTVLGFIAAGLPQLVPPVVCLIVGLHFLPLARLFDQPQYRWACAGLSAASVAGLLTLAAGPGAEASRLVVGFAAAATLWATSARLAVRS